MGNFKDWLRKEIAKNDWTYEKLGEAIGAKESSISQWANGKHVPKPPVLLRLAGVAHEDPFKLLNLAYDWPLPNQESNVPERIAIILRQLDQMTDDELARVEDYFVMIIGSRVRRGKNAKSKGSPVDRDVEDNDAGRTP